MSTRDDIGILPHNRVYHEPLYKFHYIFTINPQLRIHPPTPIALIVDAFVGVTEGKKPWDELCALRARARITDERLYRVSTMKPLTKWQFVKFLGMHMEAGSLTDFLKEAQL